MVGYTFGSLLYKYNPIKINIDNHEESIKIIREAIKNNEWEKRIDIIKNEKKRILNEMQIMPIIEKIINKNI